MLRVVRENSVAAIKAVMGGGKPMNGSEYLRKEVQGWPVLGLLRLTSSYQGPIQRSGGIFLDEFSLLKILMLHSEVICNESRDLVDVSEDDGRVVALSTTPVRGASRFPFHPEAGGAQSVAVAAASGRPARQ
jgi:hypothetical protein